METVKELLVQCKKKAQQLNQIETDLVLDHTIYSRAVEVVMEEQHSDLRDFINFRMSGFHATCVFLGVIGKQFGDVGLKDVMVEAGILGEDAAQNVLRGKHCNNGIRAHVYVAEAIARVKLDAFLEWLLFHDKHHVYDIVFKSDEVKKIEFLRNSDNLTDCVKIICPLQRIWRWTFWQKTFPYGFVLEFVLIGDSNIERLCKINKDWWLRSARVCFWKNDSLVSHLRLFQPRTSLFLLLVHTASSPS